MMLRSLVLTHYGVWRTNGLWLNRALESTKNAYHKNLSLNPQTPETNVPSQTADLSLAVEMKMMQTMWRDLTVATGNNYRMQ